MTSNYEVQAYEELPDEVVDFIAKTMVEKWNGKLPTTMLGDG